MRNLDCTSSGGSLIEEVAERDQLARLELVGGGELEAAEDRILPSRGGPRIAVPEGEVPHLLHGIPGGLTAVRLFEAWQRIEWVSKVIRVVLVIELQGRRK